MRYRFCPPVAIRLCAFFTLLVFLPPHKVVAETDDIAPRQCLTQPSSNGLLEDDINRSLERSQLQTTTSDSNFQWQIVAKEIIHELVGDDVHTSLGSYPDLRVFKGKFPNAFSHRQNQVTVSSGLLRRIESLDEFAFVIAHELGHLFLKHSDLAPAHDMNEYIEREKAADRYALTLLEGGKFDPDKGSKILRRLAETELRFGKLASMYPSLNERILALK